MIDIKQETIMQPMRTLTSDVGLKITSRSSNPNYTCEYPYRSTVAKENFKRRKYQVEKCGYNSNPIKPYKELGDVVLDVKSLVLETLGQEDKKNTIVEDSSSGDEDSCDSLLEVKETGEISKAVLVKRSQLEDLNTIDQQLNKGVYIIRRVQLGMSLFDILDKEKKIKQEIERKKNQEEERQRKFHVKPANQDEHIRAEEGEPSGITKYAGSKAVHVVSQELRAKFDSAHRVPLDSSQEPQLPPTFRKKRNTILHSSTVVRSSSSSFGKRLSTSNFSNDTSLSTSLSYRKQNESPFPPHVIDYQSKKKTKTYPRPYSPIYTNINSYQIASSEALFRQLCVINWILEAMSQDNNPPIMQLISLCWKHSGLQSEQKVLQKCIEPGGDIVWQSFLQNPSRFQSRKMSRATMRRPSTKVTVSTFQPNLVTTKCVSTTVISEVEHGGESVTLENTPSVVNNGIQSLLGNEAMSKVDSAKKSHSSRNSNLKRVKSASNLKLTVEIAQGRMRESVARDIRQKFEELKSEQAVILHDNLKEQARYRLASFEKKFYAVNVMKNLYETLAKFRENGRVDKCEEVVTTSTPSEWYTTLVKVLDGKKIQDRNISLILKKIGNFADAEGRKTSCLHFLRTLSTLRPFELCHPDISAGIEFVRDKIVFMNKTEFETWRRKHIKEQKRVKSAPPAIL